MKFFVIIVQTHEGASPVIQVPSDTKPLNNLDRAIVIFCQTFYYESMFTGYKRLIITKNNRKQGKERLKKGPNLLNQHFRNSDMFFQLDRNEGASSFDFQFTHSGRRFCHGPWKIRYSNPFLKSPICLAGGVLVVLAAPVNITNGIDMDSLSCYKLKPYWGNNIKRG